LLPFYQNVASALDPDSLAEVTEGVAHVVAAQPLDRIYDIMGSFYRPIAEQLNQYQALAPTDDEKILRKIAGTFSTFQADFQTPLTF
jgi:transportin-3